MHTWQRRTAALLVMALGAAWGLTSCGDGDSAPIPVANPPGFTTAPAGIPGGNGPTSSIAKPNDYAGLAPILPLGGDQVATTMPDGQLWAKFPNGMAYQDIKSGMSAQPSPGQTVYIFYKASVAGADAPFAQSEKGKPQIFRLGSTTLPSGLNTAIFNTQRGAKRRWWIPPELAFGEKGLPPLVGPNKAVIYELEIQQWDGKAVDMPSLTNSPMGPSADMGPPAPASAPATAP